ncbi:hypothetical protein HOLleu_36687 [Holothuria leucospilota]|uniref:Uncharacterized protein n=1 Tax=Holothuria leucospilota TaxID=206669 RepID=A0A9Q1BG75_HOLLE|nr:hypothetical protein HOLleu_36687 [Holothuria leucospilota]
MLVFFLNNTLIVVLVGILSGFINPTVGWTLGSTHLVKVSFLSGITCLLKLSLLKVLIVLKTKLIQF